MLIQMEYELEQIIRPWILEVRRTKSWATLIETERRFLDIRFSLASSPPDLW